MRNDANDDEGVIRFVAAADHHAIDVLPVQFGARVGQRSVRVPCQYCKARNPHKDKRDVDDEVEEG